MKNCFYPIVLMLLSFNVSAAGASPFYTGLWEYTIEIKVPGLAQSELKKVQKCIRELNDVISLFNPDPSCSVGNVQATDTELSWRLYCKNVGGTYHGDAKIQGNERTQEGKVNLETIIPGMKNIMQTSYVITGVNLGVCQ
jgi:hypothetical protein